MNEQEQTVSVGSDAVVVLRLSSAKVLDLLANWEENRDFAAKEWRKYPRPSYARERWQAREGCLDAVINDLRLLTGLKSERQPQHNGKDQPHGRESGGERNSP